MKNFSYDKKHPFNAGLIVSIMTVIIAVITFMIPVLADVFKSDFNKRNSTMLIFSLVSNSIVFSIYSLWVVLFCYCLYKRNKGIFFKSAMIAVMSAFIVLLPLDLVYKDFKNDLINANRNEISTKYNINNIPHENGEHKKLIKKAISFREKNIKNATFNKFIKDVKSNSTTKELNQIKEKLKK